MSAASTPAPRANPQPAGHALFWPIFIFFVGYGTLAMYQVMNLEDQLDEVTRAVDKMDTKVTLAKHEKDLFFGLAREVLIMAPKHPEAEKIAVEFKIRQLKAAQPRSFELPQLKAASEASASQAAAVTNSAPVTPLETSNTLIPLTPAAPPGK